MIMLQSKSNSLDEKFQTDGHIDTEHSLLRLQ